MSVNDMYHWIFTSKCHFQNFIQFGHLVQWGGGSPKWDFVTLTLNAGTGRGVCVGVCVRRCSSPHSKRGPESFFYIQSEDILTKRGQNFSPRIVTRCTVLTFPYWCRGYGRKSSLCTCQACSEVWEKMASLWMCYTQICPRFECWDEHTIHTCV